jgi:hypothetical protein
MFETQPYIVYIKPDAKNRITAVDSSAFIANVDGWIEIGRGFDDKHHHAQGNFFPMPIYDERGICRYLFTPDAETLWRERTQEEMDADWEEPVPEPDQTERIEALEAQLAAYEAAYAEGVNEA